jgi:transcriptional regulator GlxA family with amidase domain
LRIAFIIYNKMTTMGFMGVFDPITRMKTMGFRKDIEWDICAFTEKVTDTTDTLTIIPTKVRPDLGDYDMFIIGGGYGRLLFWKDPEFMAWLKTGAATKYKVAVCGGTLFLAEAGFLKGKQATTNHNAFPEMEPYVTSIPPDRVVDEGDVITAAGVTSALDLGLYLVHKIAGPEVMEKIRAQIEYNGLGAAGITSFGEPIVAR